MLATRTYKAKKPIYKEIENVHELCRLCLEKTQDGVAIFKDDQDACAAVAMRIVICVGVEMNQEHSLPNMICKGCYEELEKYYKFRKKSQMSYQRLKYHLLALKLKHQKKVLEEIDVPLENIPLENIPGSETVEDCMLNNIKPDIQDVKKQTSQTNKEPSEVIEDVAENAIEVKEVQIPLQPEESPDIGTFLTTILSELGILRQEHGLVQHQGISSFELETGDDEQLMLELVEEDEELENQSAPESVDPDDMIIDVKPHPVITKRGKMSRPWCSLCGWSFSSRSALARHVRAHSGARPHACSDCGATFAQKAVLHRHMLVHLEVRPHRCSLCSKSFTQRSALEAHARTHAPPHARALALHRCTVCDKVFLYASGLSRHMVSHDGRVFKCSACDKYFRDRSSLVRHLRTVCHAPASDNTTEPA